LTVGLLLLLLFMGGLGLLTIAFVMGARWLHATRDDSPRRRWARVAQRRAPTVTKAESEANDLLTRVERQVELLYTERHRLGLIEQRARALAHRAEQLEPGGERAQRVRRELALLDDKQERLDRLIARYTQCREELTLRRDAAALHVMMADGDQSGEERLAEAALVADELDEQAERLLAVAEAERELEDFLSA
jgi:hypothetical protein